jgi:transcriptional regulator with GAF, ATPase, and Fis domain
LIGTSVGMSRVKSLIARVAPSDTTVLLRGESGTGKELVAAALHELSSRNEGRFVRVNCAAVVETLLASELFGHERGSFTGAHARKKGWFEVADGGTLFLDEIGDISAKTQAALLRVLQHQEFERVGGTETVRVDVRVLAATNANLEELVKTSEFRQDLYYRLAAVTISIPPLRTRLEDLGELAEHLLERIAADTGTDRKLLSPDALRFLRSHRWPGNVRELENVLRSTALLSESQVLEPRHFRMYAEHLEGEALDIEVGIGGGMPGPGRESGLAQLFYDRVRKGDGSIYDLRKMLERESIARALSETGGNITKAADLLGMKRPRLSQLIKEYGLER